MANIRGQMIMNVQMQYHIDIKSGKGWGTLKSTSRLKDIVLTMVRRKNDERADSP